MHTELFYKLRSEDPVGVCELALEEKLKFVSGQIFT
jgi:hypothetical protein